MCVRCYSARALFMKQTARDKQGFCPVKGCNLTLGVDTMGASSCGAANHLCGGYWVTIKAKRPQLSTVF